jgi:hypothetical protein
MSYASRAAKYGGPTSLDIPLRMPYYKKAIAKRAKATWDPKLKGWRARNILTAFRLQDFFTYPDDRLYIEKFANIEWFDVPYDNNEEAKRAWAKWHIECRCWHFPIRTCNTNLDKYKWVRGSDTDEIMFGTREAECE